MSEQTDIKILAADLSTILNEIDISMWSRDGYWCSTHTLSTSIVSELIQRVLLITFEKDDSYNSLRDNKVFLNSDKKLEIIYNVHWKDDYLQAFCLHPVFGKIAASLLKCRSIRLWGTQLIIKYPGSEKDNHIHWHRDRVFWQCVDRPKLLTIWIPLDNTTKENGCLHYIKASHTSNKQAHRFAVDKIEEIHANAGQILIHHCRTLHKSNSNSSTSPRKALAIHLMDGNMRYKPDTKSDNHMNVFLSGGVPYSKFRNNYFPILFETNK